MQRTKFLTIDDLLFFIENPELSTSYRKKIRRRTAVECTLEAALQFIKETSGVLAERRTESRDRHG